MEFGLYFAQQLPRPWGPDDELDLFQESLDQVELADRLGYGYAWAPEQHFLEEYSHSSAPEVFLAAAGQRTRTIRLGHAVVLMPPGYNEPARVAERIATLDLLTRGRVEFGIGHSKTRVELEGFGVDPRLRHEMSLEALGQVTEMMAREPYPGHVGTHFSMPARNLVPKPAQRPHPPLWIACSDDETVRLAARLGIGALAHSFFDAAEAHAVVEGYTETFKRDCVPIGHTVNPRVATMVPFHCHPDAEVARTRGERAGSFFTYAVRHYHVFGRHRPGDTNLWERSEIVRKELGGSIPHRGGHAIGSPEEVTALLRGYQEAGIDQTILLHQFGRLPYDQVRASLELFAAEVMPGFAAEHAAIRARRDEELAPYVEAALARRERGAPAPAPLVDAYGLSRPPVEDPDAHPPHIRDVLLELARMAATARRLDS
ncbi:LLM class flavin-dependent oxidoreductase [Pseudonocardia sp. NPDC049154]|uniref:LLM class flavin-dependent oxidoreductase n=1 Tax=Pseudonocardia sp. NPDC049154 TaxID=3155501 RepID=UPI00340E220D